MPGDLIKGNRISRLQELRLRLTDRHQPAATLLAHRPAGHPHDKADHQRKRQQRQQQTAEQTRLSGRLGLDHDALLLQLSDEACALRDVGRDATACRALGDDLLPLDGDRANLALVDRRDERGVGKLLELGC
jgi:hypothetical protein